MTGQTGIGLFSLSPTCFIQPKSTGLVSLFLQAVLIIISGIIFLFFFYHVGGYEYTHWNENSTILEPINHSQITAIHKNDQHLSNELLTVINNNDTLVSTANRNLAFLKQNITSEKEEESNVYGVFRYLEYIPPHNYFFENASFGIEQVPTTTVLIGGIELDWLEVIRISTIMYIGICVVWMLTGIIFICTIRCEMLDTIVLNTAVLILVVLFQSAHAGLITSLIFFQREMSWRTLLITIGSIVIVFCCAFLGFVCITLNCGWVQFIDHMHGGKNCTLCNICFKKTLHKTRNKNENVEASLNVPQINYDIPLNNFDAF